MQIHITARHIDLTPSLSGYVQKKIERVADHFRALVRAQVVLVVEKNRHIAEVVVHSDGHHDFRANEESADMYAAVDLVADKLYKHLARQKDKRVRGRRRKHNGLPEEIMASFPVRAEGGESDETGPRVTSVRRFTPPTMTTAEAADELRRRGLSFIMFLNEDTLSVLFEHKDGTFGILEPKESR